jgi:hypothetical protein
MRFQEDLKGAATETRVLHRHRAFACLSLTLGVAGQDPEQQRLAGFHRAQRVEADRSLGTGAPDETLDCAVGTHDGRVPCPDARRALRPDDGGCREGRHIARLAAHGRGRAVRGDRAFSVAFRH